MTKPFSRLCLIPQRHLLPLTLLTCALTTGCQSPGFATALSGRKPEAQTVSSTAPAESEQAGLPEPTNTASSNSPLSLSSIDEHLRLGEQELGRGNFQQAQLHFEHVLEKHPDHAKANHRLGVLADKLGRFDQAEEHYLTALAGDPQNAALLSDLGYSYFMQGRYADAERYLLESRKADPQYDTAIANLGLLYGSIGRKQEALALFRRLGDDEQVQAIMSQIDGGKFGPAGKLAANTPASQQSSAVTMQSSVQQSGSGDSRGLHHDPMQDFAEQLRKAREELRRAEEEFARHQQAQQSPHGQLAQAAGHQFQQQPQQAEWAQQTPSSPQQQGQQPTWQNQQMLPQYAQPNGDAARFDALANEVQPFDPAGRTHPAAASGPQDIAGPLPVVTPRERHRSASADTPSGAPEQPSTARTSSPADAGGLHQPASSFASQQSAAVGGRSHSPQAPLGQSPWDQASTHSGGMAHGEPNSFTPSGNSRAGNPPAAWGQQFATSVEQSAAQGTSNASQSIQQLSGDTQSPAQQKPVEHAYHTQQQHAQNNITLAGQDRPASAGSPSQSGNQPPGSQSYHAHGEPGASAPQSNSFEAARREAALLGLNAGPGQVFPYIQRYERVRTDADPQSYGGQQNYGAQQHHGGQSFSGHGGGVIASAAGAQPAQQWSPQQNGSQQPVPQQSQQQPSHTQQQWQQQTTSQNPPHTPSQPASQTGGQFTQAWGQQSQPGSYGGNSTTTTQHYGPTPTPAAPYSRPSHVTPVPYYERSNAGGQSGVVPTGYEGPQPSAGYAPQQASGSVVVPEAYHNRQPAPAGPYQQPPAQHQQQHQQRFQHQQPYHQQQPQVHSNQRPYTGPMIVPGER